MQNRRSSFLIAWLLLPFFLSASHAQVVIHHLGANDPETEGFVITGAGNAEFEPVFDDFGRDAWSINTRAGTEFGFYNHQLSAQDQQNAATYGWVLSATMRLVNTPDGGGNLLRYHTGSKMFFLGLSADAGGSIFIRDGLGGQYQFDGSDGGYHQYEFVYDPLSEMAALWIDGVERVSDWAALSGSSESQVSFGAGQAVTHSHWNEVSLTIVPEPATVALLSGIGALFFVGGVRWRIHRTKRVTDRR